MLYIQDENDAGGFWYEATTGCWHNFGLPFDGQNQEMVTHRGADPRAPWRGDLSYHADPDGTRHWGIIPFAIGRDDPDAVYARGGLDPLGSLFVSHDHGQAFVEKIGGPLHLARLGSNGAFALNFEYDQTQFGAPYKESSITPFTIDVAELVSAIQPLTPGSYASTTINNTPLSPSLPFGSFANNIAILTAVRADTAATMATPTGWTQLVAANNGGMRCEVWWRRLQSGDTGPTFMFGTGTTVRAAQIMGVRGCPTDASPFGQLSGGTDAISFTPNSGTTLVAPADISPTTDTYGLFAFASNVAQPGGGAGATQPTNWTAFSVAARIGYSRTSSPRTRLPGSYGPPSTTLANAASAFGILLSFRARIDLVTQHGLVNCGVFSGAFHFSYRFREYSTPYELPTSVEWRFHLRQWDWLTGISTIVWSSPAYTQTAPDTTGVTATFNTADVPVTTWNDVWFDVTAPNSTRAVGWVSEVTLTADSRVYPTQPEGVIALANTEYPTDYVAIGIPFMPTYTGDVTITHMANTAAMGAVYWQFVLYSGRPYDIGSDDNVVWASTIITQIDPTTPADYTFNLAATSTTVWNALGIRGWATTPIAPEYAGGHVTITVADPEAAFTYLDPTFADDRLTNVAATGGGLVVASVSDEGLDNNGNLINGGLWRSTDDGDTWNRLAAQPDNTTEGVELDLSAGKLWWVEAHASPNHDEVLIKRANLDGSSVNIVGDSLTQAPGYQVGRSYKVVKAVSDTTCLISSPELWNPSYVVDESPVWKVSSGTGITNICPPALAAGSPVDITALTTSTYICAGTVTRGSPNEDDPVLVYRSTDAGSTWDLVHTIPASEGFLYNAGFSYKWYWQVSSLWGDPDHVAIMGNANADLRQILWMSNDAGVVWHTSLNNADPFIDGEYWVYYPTGIRGAAEWVENSCLLPPIAIPGRLATIVG